MDWLQCPGMLSMHNLLTVGLCSSQNDISTAWEVVGNTESSGFTQTHWFQNFHFNQNIQMTHWFKFKEDWSLPTSSHPPFNSLKSPQAKSQTMPHNLFNESIKCLSSNPNCTLLQYLILSIFYSSLVSKKHHCLLVSLLFFQYTFPSCPFSTNESFVSHRLL